MEKTLIEKYKLSTFIEGPKEHKEDIKKIDSLVKQATFVMKETAKGKLLDRLFPTIEPTFLNIKNRKKINFYHGDSYRNYRLQITLPSLVVYSLDNPKFEMEDSFWAEYGLYRKYARISEAGRGGIITSKLPKVFTNPLTEAVVLSATQKRKVGYYDKLFEYEWKAWTIFEGLIPKKVKKIIEVTKPIFEDRLYIMAEATKWNSKVKIHVNDDPKKKTFGDTFPRDPLLIGVGNNNQCYLLSQFNCSDGLLRRIADDEDYQKNLKERTKKKRIDKKMDKDKAVERLLEEEEEDKGLCDLYYKNLKERTERERTTCKKKGEREKGFRTHYGSGLGGVMFGSVGNDDGVSWD